MLQRLLFSGLVSSTAGVTVWYNRNRVVEANSSEWCTIDEESVTDTVKNNGHQTPSSWKRITLVPGYAEHLNPKTSDCTLLSSLVFIRHGARTPIKYIEGISEASYDKNCLLGSGDLEVFRAARAPYTDVPMQIFSVEGNGRPPALLDDIFRRMPRLKGGLRAGVLTATGRDQGYQLGKRLQAKYMDKYNILSAKYDPQQIYLRSTNLDRTIDTLQCVVAGLYGKPNINDPLKVEVTPLPVEHLFPNTTHCPILQKNFRNVKKLMHKENDFVRETINKIKKVIGEDIPVEIMYWRDNISVRKVHGLHIPPWLEELYPEIDKAATLVFEATWCGYKHDLLHVAAGPVLNTIRLNLIQSAYAAEVETSDTSDELTNRPKVSLYSCHDASLVPLCKSLGIYDGKWPPYCAAVEIDLLENSQHEKFVEVSYCGEVCVLPGQRHSLIPLDQFLAHIAQYSRTMAQFFTACGNKDNITVQKNAKLILPENIGSAKD